MNKEGRRLGIFGFSRPGSDLCVYSIAWIKNESCCSVITPAVSLSNECASGGVGVTNNYQWQRLDISHHTGFIISRCSRRELGMYSYTHDYPQSQSQSQSRAPERNMN